MNFEPSEEQLAFAQTARDFAAAEFAPHAARWDAEAFFPREAIAKAGELAGNLSHGEQRRLQRAEAGQDVVVELLDELAPSGPRRLHALQLKGQAESVGTAAEPFDGSEQHGGVLVGHMGQSLPPVLVRQSEPPRAGR